MSVPTSPGAERPLNLKCRHAARSDRGFVRAANEDSLYAGERLLALADGLDGPTGAIASQLVVAALAHLDEDEPHRDLPGPLDQSVRCGNSAIAGHFDYNLKLAGIGTTLTAMSFGGDCIALARIGHSRCYLLRDGELAQVTVDDTLVQTLVDGGQRRSPGRACARNPRYARFSRFCAFCSESPDVNG